MAIRRNARSAPAHLPAMVERLLRWLTPDETVESLAPGFGTRAARWADALGGIDMAGWQAIIAALLNGETPPFAALPDVAGQPLDRLAPRERQLVLTRAAAGALAGEEADLARLADSPGEPLVGDLAAPLSTPDVASIDTARLLAWLDGGSASAVERAALVRHFAMIADSDDPDLRAWIDSRRGDRRARCAIAGGGRGTSGRAAGLGRSRACRAVAARCSAAGAGWGHRAAAAALRRAARSTGCRATPGAPILAP